MDFSISDDSRLLIFRLSLGTDLLITASYKQGNRMKVLEMLEKFMFEYEKIMKK
jgi:hypothetical protein